MGFFFANFKVVFVKIIIIKNSGNMCNFPRAMAKILHNVILEDILELSFNIPIFLGISYSEMHNLFEFYEHMSTRDLASPIKEHEFSLGFC